MRKGIDTDEKEIDTLSSSPYLLKLADSILVNLDRKTFAELLASYLYFKSKNRSDSEFARFMMAEKFPQMFSIFMRAILPVVLPGIISDKGFRDVVANIALRSLVPMEK
jgi:hypothetical protein